MSSVAEVGSLLGTAENLTNLWRARICKILRQKCRICKFLRQNFVFVNFCHKNVTFSITRYPKIPDYSENISGRVRVLLKIIGSGIRYPSDTDCKYQDEDNQHILSHWISAADSSWNRNLLNRQQHMQVSLGTSVVGCALSLYCFICHSCAHHQFPVSSSVLVQSPTDRTE